MCCISVKISLLLCKRIPIIFLSIKRSIFSFLNHHFFTAFIFICTI
ncbi:hypothetical protein EUBVEN_00143 [Eubacterium ventriosum ATCC 27560]|uniref:Uncharacterized protein n=1 Tax=Eubacterium ventriosum ATCC 27560 TaxID=411463 RepID=A5Z398_9FIRM|nr:hypothetical protein EUBVEN_00143 [Eubacterium ventriosum ATCC 27560]